MSSKPATAMVFGTDVTIEPDITVPTGYTASRLDAITVPGGGNIEVDVEVSRVSATEPGVLTFTVGDDARSVTLQPTDNWMRIAELSATSTHSPSSVQNLNDGNTNSDSWGAGGANGWNDGTAGSFPDTVTAQWRHPVRLSRISIHTLGSRTYPAAQYGIRDVDLELCVHGAWTVVDEIRGNTAATIESRFSSANATALRLTILDSNDHAYSRLMEVEAYTT